MRLSVKRPLTGRHFVNQCAKGKNIRTRVYFLPFQLFRSMYCRVPMIVPCAVMLSLAVGRSERGLGGAELVFNFARPKSSSFVPDFVNITLAWLQIAVCDTHAMRLIQRIGDLDCVLQDLFPAAKAPLSSRCARVSPSMYSITRNSVSSWCPTS